MLFAAEIEDGLSKLSLQSDETESSSGGMGLTRSQKKYLKKKEKKKASPGLAFEIEEVIEPTSVKKEENSPPEPTSKEINSSQHQVVPSDARAQNQEPVDTLKRIRAIRKKLKQIAELESRIASGDIKKPDQCQREKIAKKSEYEQELLLLEKS